MQPDPAFLGDLRSAQAIPHHVPAGLTIVEALRIWSSWNVNVPPTGSTGDSDFDTRIADAFRMLIFKTDRVEKLDWLHEQLFTTNDFVPPDAPADLYRATLIRWWLDIYDGSE